MIIETGLSVIIGPDGDAIQTDTLTGTATPMGTFRWPDSEDEEDEDDEGE